MNQEPTSLKFRVLKNPDEKLGIRLITEAKHAPAQLRDEVNWDSEFLIVSEMHSRSTGRIDVFGVNQFKNTVTVDVSFHFGGAMVPCAIVPICVAVAVERCAGLPLPKRFRLKWDDNGPPAGDLCCCCCCTIM